ncbi:hypothetical protein PsorP6_013728 [Peronosclerospora sorghi]|uniref:Uncharacterized protein n=1 Tax=Peronosclerospora sorghi TaxID=230839 RepID=A0ACC0VJR7_9STRA|nr:hypothetical protein PsorP6_013728 [Peronosclerospora sorghi]
MNDLRTDNIKLHHEQHRRVTCRGIIGMDALIFETMDPKPNLALSDGGSILFDRHDCGQRKVTNNTKLP